MKRTRIIFTFLTLVVLFCITLSRVEKSPVVTTTNQTETTTRLTRVVWMGDREFDECWLEERIKQTLKSIDVYDERMIDLLKKTAMYESQNGVYTMQRNPSGKSNILGVFQIKKSTFLDLKKRNSEFEKDIEKVYISEKPLRWNLRYNLSLQIITANHYYRDRLDCLGKPLPPTHDIWKQGEIYKICWNTSKGLATTKKFVAFFQ